MKIFSYRKPAKKAINSPDFNKFTKNNRNYCDSSCIYWNYRPSSIRIVRSGNTAAYSCYFYVYGTRGDSYGCLDSCWFYRRDLSSREEGEK